MFKKSVKFIGFSALLSSFLVLTPASHGLSLAAENLPLTAAADKVLPTKAVSAGFYQFNNLEIFKTPSVSEPPATIEVIQKNEKSCVIYENGKNDRPLSCVFSGLQNNNYLVQIDERTTLLGVNQEPSLLSDFSAGDKVNVLGWLSADGKTIRAAVLRSIENKNFHQSLSGTVKNVTSDGFTLVLENGSEVLVKSPIVEGAQITINGVFDKINNTINSVLSIIIKPNVVLLEKPVTEPETPSVAPSAKPSRLFKNFLKVFGL